VTTRTPRLLLIDNYDSFTYNLVQAFLVLGADVLVYRNDAIAVEEARALSPTHLCISPGPGTPYDAGVSMDMIRAFAGRIPVLGVCLGHQSIVEVFGGKVVRAGRLMHGKTSVIHHDGLGAFAGLPQPCEVGRYHSLIAAPDTLPPELIVTARTAEGEIMGVRHRDLAVEGVQFHPESILTPDGPRLLGNFLADRPANSLRADVAAGTRSASVRADTAMGNTAGAGNGRGA
jgi:anthranilate synthase/aminodeoxychorismate synthase-like glutamine amidotransferase